MPYHPLGARVVLPMTEFTLCEWLGAAAAGDQLVYHRGFLAIDLDPRVDRLTRDEQLRLSRVARRAQILASQDLAHLVQRRHSAANFTYLLIARHRPRPNNGALHAVLNQSAFPGLAPTETDLRSDARRAHSALKAVETNEHGLLDRQAAKNMGAGP
jgi:hypothetical protein